MRTSRTRTLRTTIRKKNHEASEFRNEKRRQRTLVIVVCVCLIIIGFAITRMVVVVQTFKGVKQQLASLEIQNAQVSEKKENLINTLKRWNEKAYIVEQARSQFGFVFPGETPVTVTSIPPEDLDQKPLPEDFSPDKLSTNPRSQINSSLKDSNIPQDQIPDVPSKSTTQSHSAQQKNKAQQNKAQQNASQNNSSQ